MNLTEGKPNTAMTILAQIALQYIGVPYIYGGKNALQGLDCSGLVCELLHALGAIPFGFDANALGIHSHFAPLSKDGEITTGSLAFYGPDLKSIDHVAMFLDTHLIIEAGHGTPQTLTKEIATQRGAMVRVRPYNYRKDLVCVLRPNYEDMGFNP